MPLATSPLVGGEQAEADAAQRLADAKAPMQQSPGSQGSEKPTAAGHSEGAPGGSPQPQNGKPLQREPVKTPVQVSILPPPPPPPPPQNPRKGKNALITAVDLSADEGLSERAPTAATPKKASPGRKSADASQERSKSSSSESCKSNAAIRRRTRTPARRRTRDVDEKGRGAARRPPATSFCAPYRGERHRNQHGMRPKMCRFDRQCKHSHCSFAHPNGRVIDERNDKRKRRCSRSRSRNGRRGRSPARERDRRQRAASSSARRSPSEGKKKARRKSKKTRKGGSCDSEASSKKSTCKTTKARKPAQDEDVKVAKGTFRDFVLHNVDDTMSPDAIVNKFKEHRKTEATKQAQEVYEKIKDSQFFAAEYHPRCALQHFELKIALTHLRATSFLEACKQGAYKDLSLTMPEGAVRQGAICKVGGHLQEPHYAYDPNAAMLIIGPVQTTVSPWDIVTLMQSTAYTGIKLPDADEKQENAVVHMFFASGMAAQQSADVFRQLAGGNTKLKWLKCTLAVPTGELQGMVLPPEMSHPEQLQKDLQLSMQIVRQLDSLLGLPPSHSEEVLSLLSEAPAEAVQARLDLNLTYLRRVHHFCFYGASWCSNEFDLHAKCGSVVLRDMSQAPPGVWSEGHEKRLNDFTATAEFVRPSIPTIGDWPWKEMCDQLKEQAGVQIREDKFQCVHCKKFFKGMEYIRKHFSKMHTNLLDDVQNEAHLEAAKSAFLADAVANSMI
eukprot:TRINITY_DN8448_c0_g1_i3.p1 TRINITY_DN8448_c0_g1~~TRINITY_DN8448_c0_g1_i3.p1  ORF type:complete len:728 (-),score=190.60 TRINITY_DN8448_c0_g1_i3:281-2464(-)